MNEDSLYVCKLCFQVMLCFLSNSLVGLDETITNAENKNNKNKTRREKKKKRCIQSFHLAVSFFPTLLPLSRTSRQTKNNGMKGGKSDIFRRASYSGNFCLSLGW